MERKKIFLAIPEMEHPGGSTFRMLDRKKVRERTDLTAARFSRAGWTVVSPLDNFTGKGATFADSAADFVRMALSCDAVYLAWSYFEDWRLDIVQKAVECWNIDETHKKIYIMYGD